MESASVVFDRYQLEQRIGAGGMGVVWRATDLLLDQPVALKRIMLAGMDAEQAELTRARALREARTAARLRHHPHVVATHDVRIDDGDVWLVLEYLPSRSLATLCREQGPLEIVEVARIGAAVADALAAGHAQSIVHRDVTPGNVLIADDGRVKLTDFGISRLSGHDQITHDGVISGTIAYLAPEVAASGVCTPASDLFSLGSTLYAALEGQPPFGTDDNTLRLLNVVRNGIIQPPESAGALTSLLLRLLQYNPIARPDAATARDLLSNFAHRLTAPTEYLPPTDQPTPNEDPPPSVDPRPPPPEPSPSPRLTRWPAWLRWPHRHRLLAAVLTVITLAAIGLGTGLGVHALTATAVLVGVPPLPTTVDPIALTGDPRAADPCALIDLAWLRQFGTPRITTPTTPNGCRVHIAAPNGANPRLTVDFTTPASPRAWISGQRQRLGALTIAREDGKVRNTGNTCRNVLVLADRTRIAISAYNFTGAKAKKNFDLCTLADVGTATAVNALADHGITYQPDRAAGWPITRGDACTLLTNAELTTLGDVDPTIRTPGYANWSCDWGTSTTSVTVDLRLDNATLSRPYGDLTTIARRRAWLRPIEHDNRHQCEATVVAQPARFPTDATQMIQITIHATQPDQTLCTRATNLAAAAITRVPTT